MQYLIKLFSIATVFSIAICQSCTSKSENSTSSKKEILVTEQNKNIQISSNKSLYYSKVNKSILDSAFNNYHLLFIEIDDNNNVKGYEISAPFGTDGSRGHLYGSIDPPTKTLSLKNDQYGEGEISTFDTKYKMVTGQLIMDFEDVDGQPYTLSEVSESKFLEHKKLFEDMIMDINTTDKSRIAQLPIYKELNDDDKENFTFLETRIELDNNYDTEEYLLYPYGRFACGTGGCNMYVTDDKGNIISTTSVVKLPTYRSTSLIESMKKEGEWEDLYIWSDGAFRVLKHGKDGYDPNGSLAIKSQIQDIDLHPQHFVKVLDFN